MGGQRNSGRESRSVETDQEDDEKPRSIFQRLFSPDSADTSVSSDSDNDDGSAGTDTRYSTLSTTSSAQFSDTGTERSENDSMEKFDRDLRARHRGACKNMTGGKYGKAIKIFENILADLLDKFGEEHHRVGAALHNVAVANLRAGQLNDARDAIEEAVRIRKLTMGDQSPKVADSLVEYGIILLSMKKHEESLEVFREAFLLREREAQLAKNTENAQEAYLKMAKIRHNIGCVNFEMGKFPEAKRAYIEAIGQQKAAFGSWSSFMMLTDTTKPGFLTMASTMCNKGYIDLEQENHIEAISVFNESLKIQRVLLEADNKLILGTLENLGYAYCMNHEFEKGLKVYEELVKLQQESYGDQAQKGWAQAMKKLIFCQAKLYEFERAFDNLRALEEYLSAKAVKTRASEEDLQKTHELMGEVNYQIFKFPTITEYSTRAFGCGLCRDDRDAVEIDPWWPKKPVNGSKMSGHRMTYA